MINNLDRKQNRVAKLNNSKWTSIEKLNGWRHYEVLNINKKDDLIELFAICDKSIKVFCKKSDLKNKGLWIRGWTAKDQKEKLPSM